jgi:hypothetical protein
MYIELEKMGKDVVIAPLKEGLRKLENLESG